MWPSIRDAVVMFFTDKTYFQSKWDKWVTKVRFAFMFLGAAVAIPGEFQNKVLAMVPSRYVQWVGLALMGFGVLFRAGDRTPQNVKDLAQQITPPDGTQRVS